MRNRKGLTKSNPKKWLEIELWNLRIEFLSWFAPAQWSSARWLGNMLKSETIKLKPNMYFIGLFVCNWLDFWIVIFWKKKSKPGFRIQKLCVHCGRYRIFCWLFNVHRNVLKDRWNVQAISITCSPMYYNYENYLREKCQSCLRFFQNRERLQLSKVFNAKPTIVVTTNYEVGYIVVNLFFYCFDSHCFPIPCITN